MITALTLWLAASVLVAWLAGRFIRVGMVDHQSEQQGAQP